jgi:hypothetical protein
MTRRTAAHRSGRAIFPETAWPLGQNHLMGNQFRN